MLRRLFTILSALSLVLCMWMCVWWSASYKLSPKQLTSEIAIGSWNKAIEISYDRYPGKPSIWSAHKVSEFKGIYAGVFVAQYRFTDVPGNPLFASIEIG